MAFIRSYGNRYRAVALSELGDPFIGRLFKKIKKWQPGKTLARLAPTALSLVPGVGGLAGRLAFGGGPAGGFRGITRSLSRFASIAQRLNVPISMVQDIASQYGFEDEGDPKPQRKRQGAKRSAQKKATRRPKGKRAGRRPSGSKQSIDYGKLLEKGLEAAPGIGSAAAAVLAELRRSTGSTVLPGAGIVPSVPDDLESQIAAQMGGGRRTMRLPGMGGRRRSINPANVKALRRSMRRVEGFQTLVKRVQKAFPKLRPVTSSRPHKKGCKCGGCR